MQEFSELTLNSKYLSRYGRNLAKTFCGFRAKLDKLIDEEEFIQLLADNFRAPKKSYMKNTLEYLKNITGSGPSGPYDQNLEECTWDNIGSLVYCIFYLY